VNGEQLVKLLVKHGIGATCDQIEILELDTDSDLFSPAKQAPIAVSPNSFPNIVKPPPYR
jgi:hypothetical protein